MHLPIHSISHPSIYTSNYPSIPPSFNPSLPPSFNLPSTTFPPSAIHLPIHSVSQSPIHLYIQLSIHRSLPLSIFHPPFPPSAMHLPIPFIHSSIYTSNYPSTDPSLFQLFIPSLYNPSTHLFIHSFISVSQSGIQSLSFIHPLPNHRSTCPSNHLSDPSFHLSTNPSFLHPPIILSFIHPSMYTSTNHQSMSIKPSIYPTKSSIHP